MEQFATALGQAAFVDGLERAWTAKGRIPFRSHDLFLCGEREYRHSRFTRCCLFQMLSYMSY